MVRKNLYYLFFFKKLTLNQIIVIKKSEILRKIRLKKKKDEIEKKNSISNSILIFSHN